MILISHRGNIFGKNPSTENSIIAINQALSIGFDVEIDVWYINNSFFLGHDKPTVSVPVGYLENPRIWCHAKNTAALFELRSHAVHYFWHQEDSYTITSKGYIWAYVGMPISEHSICVLPETHNRYSASDISKSLGICSDNIAAYII